MCGAAAVSGQIGGSGGHDSGQPSGRVLPSADANRGSSTSVYTPLMISAGWPFGYLHSRASDKVHQHDNDPRCDELP